MNNIIFWYILGRSRTLKMPLVGSTSKKTSRRLSWLNQRRENEWRLPEMVNWRSELWTIFWNKKIWSVLYVQNKFKSADFCRMFTSVIGGFERLARLDKNILQWRFWAKHPLKYIFLQFWRLSAWFKCKNTTFLLSKLFFRMELKIDLELI